MKLTTQQLEAMGFKPSETPGIWRKSDGISSISGSWAHQSDSVVASVTKPPKRIRQSTKPLLNKLEEEFFEVLKCRRAETIDRITCQSLRFELANGLWYKPDFAVWGYDSMWCYEVKGEHAFRGGFENLKMAAHRYPFIIWQLVWKDEGSWQSQTVLP